MTLAAVHHIFICSRLHLSVGCCDHFLFECADPPSGKWAGSTVIPNAGDGIHIRGGVIGSSNNTIGTVWVGNVISGNGGAGVFLEGTLGFGVQGTKLINNSIGTDATGTVKKGNTGDGVVLKDTSENVIGGEFTEPNLISGNGGNGIKFMGVDSSNNLVVANKIGTNWDGTAALGNSENGIFLSGNDNTIGVEYDEMNPQPRNIISGNGKAGIEIAGGSWNKVINCYIGTNAAGDAAIPNLKNGVVIGGVDTAANDNTIGGLTAGKRNVISGNGTDDPLDANMGYGIWIRANSRRNVLQGNYIGTGADGRKALGNTNDGVHVGAGCTDNTIGGAVGAGNLISANGKAKDGHGVYIGASGTTLTHNIIGLDLMGAVVAALANDEGWLLVAGGLTDVVTTPNDHN